MILKKNLLYDLRALKAIAWVSFFEMLQDKLLYNSLLIAGLLLSIAHFSLQLSYLSPYRIVLDFGLAAISVSGLVIAVWLGAGLVTKEFERRTVALILYHPVSRCVWLLGRCLGLFLILAINSFLLILVYFSVLTWVASDNDSLFSPILFVAIFLRLIECGVLASLAILFSTFSTTSLSVIFSIGFFCIGHHVSEMRSLLHQMSPQIAFLWKSLILILPNFEHFSLGTQVSYSFSVPSPWVYWSMAYGFILIFVYLSLASFFVRWREV